MTLHKFNKKGIEKMYQNVMEEVYKALDKGKIDKINIEIKIGKQVIKMPINADYMEYIFAALKECEEEK